MITDFTYTTNGLFTSFIPHTPEAENAWRVMAQNNNGNATFFTVHLPSILKQLKDAGYTVRKARAGKPVTEEEISALLAELGE